jgi:hypothetical protein
LLGLVYHEALRGKKSNYEYTKENKRDPVSNKSRIGSWKFSGEESDFQEAGGSDDTRHSNATKPEHPLPTNTEK